MKDTAKKLPHYVALFTATAILCTIVFVILYAHTYQWDVVWGYRLVFVKGWAMTCALSLFSLILSTCIGLVAALMRRSSIHIFRYLSLFYIETIRGTPLLVQLLICFYVIASAMHMNNRILVGVLTLSIFSGAYIAEIIRAGLESIRSSLIDSAKAIGMKKHQIYRHVIFPLMFRQVLPPLTGQFSSIIKDSSLLSIIGISELTFSAQQVASASFSTLESYIPLGVAYLFLTLPISLLSKKMERSFSYAS